MTRAPAERLGHSPLTIRDVARVAGLSKSTVSNVLSGRGRTSAATRAKVLATMEAMGYRPSVVAQSLRAQRTRVIGVVVGDLTDASNAELAGHIERAAAEAGYAVLIVSSDIAPSTEVGRVETLVDHRADAIIFIAFSGSAAAIEAVPATTPVVFASERSELGPYVAVDDEHGIALAVEHLAGLGHTRIGYVSLAHPERQIDAVRHAAFVEAMARTRLTLRRRSVVRIGHEDERIDDRRRADLLERFLTQTHRPTAVIATSDRIAFEVIAAAKLAGLGVPDDLSVVGWGNTVMARSPLIQLTTVAQPNARLAALAVEAATAAIADDAQGHRPSSTLAPWLEVRATTGAPRSDQA
jgi:LacI family transcriptional regulator